MITLLEVSDEGGFVLINCFLDVFIFRCLIVQRRILRHQICNVGHELVIPYLEPGQDSVWGVKKCLILVQTAAYDKSVFSQAQAIVSTVFVVISICCLICVNHTVYIYFVVSL